MMSPKPFQSRLFLRHAMMRYSDLNQKQGPELFSQQPERRTLDIYSAPFCTQQANIQANA